MIAERVRGWTPFRSLRGGALLAVVLTMLGATDALAACDDWTGGAGTTDWNTTGNWSAGVPTNSTDVCITQAGTVQVDLSAGYTTVNSLTLGGLTGTQTLSVRGVGLVLNAAGSIGANGRLELADDAAGTGAGYLIVNSGTLANGGTIESLAGTGAARVVEIEGSATLANTGTVSAPHALTLQGAGTFDNHGAVTAPDGGSLNVSGTTFINAADGAIHSPGTVLYASGLFTEAGTTDGNPVRIRSSTLDFSGSGASAFTVIQGTSTLQTGPHAGQSVTVQGSDETFGGNLNAAGSFTNAGTIALTGTGTTGYVGQLSLPNGSTMTNEGAILFPAQQNQNAPPVNSNGATIVNAPAGTITSEGNGQLGTGGVLSNHGLITVAAGKLMTSGAEVHNEADGTIAGPGTFSSIGGNFFEAGKVTGSPVRLQYSNLTVTGSEPAGFLVVGGISLTGDLHAGQSIIVSATPATGTGQLQTTAAMDNAGVIATTGPSSHNLFFSGGQLDNHGTISLGGPTLVAGNNTLVNHGRIETAPGTSTAVTMLLRNEAGAEVDNQGSLTSQNRFVDAGGTISGRPVTIQESNLEILPGSAGPAAFVDRGHSRMFGNLPAGEAITLRSDAALPDAVLDTDADFHNVGTIRFDTATSGTHSTQLWLAGGAPVNSGTIEVLPQPSVNARIDGANGTLTNTGTIALGDAIKLTNLTIANQGRVDVGQTATLQNVQFGQTGTGTLGIALHSPSSAGRLAGDDASELALGGTLELQPDPGFAPRPDTALPLLTETAAGLITGTFASVSPTSIGGLATVAQYGATDVTLEFSGTDLQAVSAPQSAQLDTPFADPLQASVSDDSGPVGGVVVTFTAPAAGASGTFPGGTLSAQATTGDDGVATAPAFTANSVAGDYAVAITAQGLQAAGIAMHNVAGAAPSVEIAPTGLAFATVDVGKAGPAQTVTVTNTGDGALKIAAAGFGGAQPGDFAIAQDGCSARTLLSGESCAVGVRFAPTAAGPRTALLLVADNEAGSPHSAGLSGTGATPPPAATPTATPAAAPAATASPVPAPTATPTPTPAPAVDRATQLGLPAATHCARRTLTFRLRAPAGRKLASAKVLVDGRLKRSITFKRRHGRLPSSRVTLRALPTRRFTVSLRVRLADGTTLTASRSYSPCAAV